MFGEGGSAPSVSLLDTEVHIRALTMPDHNGEARDFFSGRPSY